MTPSKIFLYFCLSFIGGIFISSFFFISQSISLTILILGILLISVFWKYKKFVIIGSCFLFLILGIWRHQGVELSFVNNELRRLNDSKENIALMGIVATEPDIREKSLKLTLDNLVVETKGTGSTFLPVSGRVLVTTWRYPEYEYGNRLKITGRLENPPIFEEFNYKDYLKKEGIYSVMSWPEIELLSKEAPSSVLGQAHAKILRFKEELRESIYQNLSPPQSSILGTMILGDKRKLTENLKEKLNIAGVRHITAISGLHVAILTSILVTILITLGFWRQQAFWLSIILITLFIIMTGFQSSAVRAGIMGGLFLLGQYFGRIGASSRLIVIAATLMLAHNPLLLKLDVGFQLSFLAMMGIIYLMPVFQGWLASTTNFLAWGQLKNILSMTLSAQTFTLPILIYNFGYLSLVAPVTNILIVPFLPFIMLLGFISGLTGIIFQPLGWILSWPTWGLLTYLTKIVDWFSGLSLAHLTIENIHWGWLIILYLVLGFITWRLQEGRKLKFLQY